MVKWTSSLASPKEVVVQAARLRFPLTTLQAGRLHYANEVFRVQVLVGVLAIEI